MSTKTSQLREENLFEEAIKLDSEAERIGFIKGACSDDAALCQRLIALATAHSQDENFILTADRDSDLDPVESPSWEGPGSVIGRYKLLQQIGEGGMGVVYMAEQQEPVQRKVALKIIKVGMDTKHVVARFEAERQALAMMDHPNIAQVHDGGATETGRPYFVMELVQGVPITKFCDKNNLSLNERLDLFIPVCHAIHSAHRKGIIHRDIKPSNILVTFHHGEPMPKVIDFGIAKATNQRLTEKTLFTQFSHMIGTPAYMSPEQAEMSSMDVDTRTDIYSLGVLLYELLTGTTPHPADRLRELAYGEMQRVIAEEEPPMPSTCLGTMEDAVKTTVAKQRSIDAQALARQFKGDIDWIVMKCLEKDRRRRYENPNELVADLRCYLNHEPVSAGAPTLTYQFKKFVGRYRSMVVGAAAVMMMFLLGAIGSTWQAVRATKAQLQAEAAEKKTNQALEKESQLRQESNRRLYHSLLDQARLTRLSRKPGFRKHIETFIQQAAALDTDQVDKYELRNEAIVAMLSPYSEPAVPILDLESDVRFVRALFNQPHDELAILDETRILRIYPLDPNEVQSFLIPTEAGPIMAFDFDYSGDFLITAHKNRALRVWERKTSMEWKTINEMPLPRIDDSSQIRPTDIAVGQNGFVVLVANTNKVLRWEQFSDQEPAIHELPEFVNNSLNNFKATISPDDQHLVIPTTREPLSLLVWDLSRKDSVTEISTGITQYRPRLFVNCEFSPDGEFLAVASYRGLFLLSTDNYETQYTMRDIWTVRDHYPFSADSQHLMTQTWMGNHRTIHLDSLVVDESLEPQGGLLAFSGRKAGLFQFVHRMKSLDARFLPESSNGITKLAGHNDQIRNMAFHPSSTAIATSSYDNTVQLHDLRTENARPRISKTYPNIPGDIAFSPNIKLVATAIRNAEGTIDICDVDSMATLQQFNLGAKAFGIAFDASGNQLAVGGKDLAKVWSLRSVKPDHPDFPFQREELWSYYEEGLGFVSEVKFSPNGRYLAFSPGVEERIPNKRLYLTDLRTGRQLPSQMEVHRDWRTFDFVSNTQLAVVGRSLNLELWNFKTNEKEQTIRVSPIEDRLMTLGISENRRYIAFYGGDVHVGIYDLKQRQTLFCAPILPEKLSQGAIRLNADATLLGIPCTDRLTRIIDLPWLQQQLATLNLGWE